jgi:tetratricopeptide (TPR) repeat protein
LEREGWAPYEDAISRIALKPFTREEVRTYLGQNGITQEELFEEIYRESKGLPVMVAFMAAAKPGESAPNASPNDTVVQRFLKWTEEPLQRQIAMDVALPRWFNKDTLAALIGPKNVDAIFTWLKSMPFVQSRSVEGGWEYHNLVRAQMLHHVQQISPEHWKSIHQRLCEYYEHLRDGLQITEGSWQNHERWRTYALEALYHRLCAGAGQALATALNGFMSAMRIERSFALAWAEVMAQAEQDSAIPPSRQHGARIVDALKAIEEKRYLEATRAFTLLLECDGLEKSWRAAALDWRGCLFLLAERQEEALRDVEAAVELEPDVAEYLRDLGQVHYAAERLARIGHRYRRHRVATGR